MGRLDGRVTIITGGARGQGASESALFAAEGAIVYLTDVLEDDGAKVAADTGATFLTHDVADAAQWQAVVDRVVADHDRIDVLVNNAGIVHWGSMTETSIEVWNRILAVNQTGVFLGMQAVAPVMQRHRSGSIVNLSSVAGMSGASTCFAYSATKWAVRGMTKGAAQELGPFGIRVNSIHPGVIDTPMLAGMDFSGVVPRVPLGRSGQPDDVAKLALWLASDDSAYATGTEFVIDGGYSA